MKIEDIIESYKKDSTLDNVELDTETMRIPSLHAKYLGIRGQENLILKKMLIDRKRLWRRLNDYYRGNSNNPSDLKALGREPWQLKVLNSDIAMHIESDEEMIDLELKLAFAKEKVSVLDEILKQINLRGYNISSAIKWRSLTQFGQQ